jgi:serine/threonine protein kinase
MAEPLEPAKWAGRETDYLLGTPVALRAPEISLQAGYDTKIAIWAVGCLVSPMLLHLFKAALTSYTARRLSSY